ncbi:MAG: hypothetical protein IJG85_08130 [Eubacteriaceae bacterium]|nr:hypothetical protein [Eubacteriaceae bacterium]
MKKPQKIEKTPSGIARFSDWIDRLWLNMGTLFIFECICFFVGYFGVYRLSKTLFFNVISHQRFNLAQSGDLSVILGNRYCLAVVVFMLMVFFVLYHDGMRSGYFGLSCFKAR